MEQKKKETWRRGREKNGRGTSIQKKYKFFTASFFFFVFLFLFVVFLIFFFFLNHVIVWIALRLTAHGFFFFFFRSCFVFLGVCSRTLNFHYFFFWVWERVLFWSGNSHRFLFRVERENVFFFDLASFFFLFLMLFFGRGQRCVRKWACLMSLLFLISGFLHVFLRFLSLLVFLFFSFFFFFVFNMWRSAAHQTRTHDAAASRDSAIGATVGTFEGQSGHGETTIGVLKKKRMVVFFLLLWCGVLCVLWG